MLAQSRRVVPSAVRAWTISTLPPPLGGKPANAWVRSLKIGWLAPPGRALKAAAVPLAFTTLAVPATTVRAPAPGSATMLGTLDLRSSSGSAAGLAAGGGLVAAVLSETAGGAAVAGLSALLNSASHFSLSWSAWVSVGDVAAALEGALNWLLLGALTCAIEPAAQKILRVVTVTVAANKARIVRQRSARLSRVVVNAISLSHSIAPVTQTLEANSEFTDSPSVLPADCAPIVINATENPHVQQKVAKMQHPCKHG